MILQKKAEITSQQIVVLIILIVSFVIILAFLVFLNLGNTNDDQICHNSIVTRGSSVVSKDSVPLNCKTSYLCITKDGNCDKMAGSYEAKKVSNKKEVYSILADEMANCWWMFGEGKINYVGTDFQSNLYCSLCSQIAFDDSIDFFENNKIDQQEVYNYLSLENYSEEETYLQYLNGPVTSKIIIDSLAKENSEFAKKINLDQQYYIMMGIYSKTGLSQWAGSGVAIGAIIGGFVGGPIGIIIGGAIGGGGAYMMGTIVKGQSGYDYLSPVIVEANSEDFDKYKCASIKTLA